MVFGKGLNGRMFIFCRLFCLMIVDEVERECILVILIVRVNFIGKVMWILVCVIFSICLFKEFEVKGDRRLRGIVIGGSVIF